MNNKSTMKIVQFAPKAGVTDEDLLTVFDRIQEEHFTSTKGVLDHKVLKGDNAWYDVTVWRSEEDMVASAAIFNTRPSVQELHRMIDILSNQSAFVARAY